MPKEDVVSTVAFPQRCFHKKIFWEYAANLQENTRAEVLKSTFIEMLFQIGALCKFAAYF